MSSGRASLLLRLEKEAELTAVDLAPRGALLLAGTARGEVLLFACSNCAVVQVGCRKEEGCILRSWDGCDEPWQN